VADLVRALEVLPVGPTGKVQWQSAVAPAYRRRAYVFVEVNGVNVTDKLEPFLISVQVIDKLLAISTCSIELDDRDAKLAIPPNDVPVIVRLGWAGEGPSIPLFRHVEAMYDLLPNDPEVQKLLNGELAWKASGMRIVFTGYVLSVESGFSRRGGGRRMWIEAQSGLITGPMKAPDYKTWGAGITNEGSPENNKDGVSLKDVLTDAFKSSGMGVVLGGELADIKRNFWMQNESPMAFAARIAGEVGASFQVIGDKVVMKPLDPAKGESSTTIEAVWGVNLISWRIKPFVGRPQWGASQQKFFDTAKGVWGSVKGAIGGSLPFGGATAVAGLPSSAPNRQVGGQLNGGVDVASQERRGEGWCIINGEPSAIAGASCVIIGARPGVDGRYLIAESEHNYTRGGGYTTRLNLQNPQIDPNVYKAMGWVNVPGTTTQIIDGKEVVTHNPPPAPPFVFPNWGNTITGNGEE
jgi:Bacteriophage probable baseplate hub protein